jgi:hypothetical protein
LPLLALRNFMQLQRLSLHASLLLGASMQSGAGLLLLPQRLSPLAVGPVQPKR